MKTAIIYYSYTGNTRARALELAKQEGADAIALTDRKRPETLAAYTAGCINALRGKATPIAPLNTNLSQYSRIVIMGPVWANYPAPPVNHAFLLLPPDVDVEVILVSGSGKSGAEERVRGLVEARGCRLKAYKDVKAP